MENKEINFNELLKEAIEKPGRLLEAYKAFHNFSLCNRILAMSQCIAKGIEISPLPTFNQWNAKDRHVKRGSRAISLCMPITKTYKKINKETWDTQPEEDTQN